MDDVSALDDCCGSCSKATSVAAALMVRGRYQGIDDTIVHYCDSRISETFSQHALGRCLSGDGLDAGALIAAARDAAAAGEIADPAHMADARVWIFHSPADEVVSPSVGAALADFYRGFVDAGRIELVEDVPAAHGWPTVDFGSECLERGEDYLNACDFDTAGRLLRHLYGDLEAPSGEAAQEELATIDLSAWFDDASSVADEGYVYVPASCKDSVGECRLHIAFYGCRQGAEFIGERFARHAGFNLGRAERYRRAIPASRSQPPESAGLLGLVGIHGRRL